MRQTEWLQETRGQTDDTWDGLLGDTEFLKVHTKSVVIPST